MSKTRVILIRHAKPAPSADYPTDAERPLLDEGKHVQQEMSERLKNEGISADLILTSPFLRARQTAEILQASLGGSILSEPGLGSDFHADQVLKRIPQNQTVLLVGHDPSLAQFANDLLGEQFLPSGMVKSGALILSFDGPITYGKATLIAYLQPQV